MSKITINQDKFSIWLVGKNSYQQELLLLEKIKKLSSILNNTKPTKVLYYKSRTPLLTVYTQYYNLVSAYQKLPPNVRKIYREGRGFPFKWSLAKINKCIKQISKSN